MKRINIVTICLTLFICVALTSCSKLPPVPDNYNTLFATPRGFEEVEIECEESLVDNEFFTDKPINGSTNFAVTKLTSYNNNDRYSLTVTDQIRQVTFEINFHKPSNDELVFTNKYVAQSAYTDSIKYARVSLSSTYNTYYTRNYYLVEEDDIFVEYTKSDIYITLCGIKFSPSSNLEDIYTLSGRIKYEK